MRYVHLNDDDVRAAMGKVKGGHKTGDTGETVNSHAPAQTAVSNLDSYAFNRKQEYFNNLTRPPVVE